ncbi:MAG: hypothetical protein VX341_02975, partial [Bdellovibrionota bacterium]|nr:hypothetical protein [Bdellovibrionota bacterium]
NACLDKREKKLEPLIEQAALIVSQNPLLGSESIDDFISEKIKEGSRFIGVTPYQMDLCKLQKRGKECDELEKKYNSYLVGDNVKLDMNEYKKELKDALDEALKSTDMLEKRHNETIQDIKKVIENKKLTNDDLKDLRDDILGSRKLTSDYFGTSGALKDDEGSFGNFHCRLVAEHEANERDAFINSLLLDAALIAIPMGGPFLLTRAASRLHKVYKIGAASSRAPRLLSGSQGATLLAELSVLGFDTKNLENEFKRCDEIIALGHGLNEIPEELRKEDEQCREKLKHVTRSYALATLGGAAGSAAMLAKARKNFKLLNDSVVNLKSENVLTKADIDDLRSLSIDNRMPLLESKYLEFLASAPADSRIKVIVSNGVKKKKLDLTAKELVEYLKNNSKTDDLSSVKIQNINYSRNFSDTDIATINSKFDKDELAGLEFDKGEMHSVIVTYPSGEVGSYSGNVDMLKELALREDITSIRYTSNPIPGVNPGYSISAIDRSRFYNAADETFQRISPSSVVSISPGNLGDLENIPISHGTIKELADSVRGGPKNVGKGFGGSGLYIDVSRNQEIAQEYASHAVQGASARLGQVGRASGDEIDTTPVVLSGRLNVTRQMRVGRFEIVRGGAVDLERGILPANWDDNPLLRRVLEERFEILDLRGMSSNGLNLNTDRILVIHENAGDDIIEWTNEVAQ